VGGDRLSTGLEPQDACLDDDSSGSYIRRSIAKSRGREPSPSARAGLAPLSQGLAGITAGSRELSLHLLQKAERPRVD